MLSCLNVSNKYGIFVCKVKLFVSVMSSTFSYGMGLMYLKTVYLYYLYVLPNITGINGNYGKKC